ANLKFAALTAGLASCLTTLPAFGQVPMEYGIDAGATFGFGDVSSVEIALPASRFRVGFPQSPRITVEPVAGLAYTKIEDTDGVLIYNLELGALYNLSAFTPPELEDAPPGTSAYIRPFVGVTGFTGGDNSDAELSVGTGIGVKVPWQPNLSWRLEANVGYGFDNKAARVGLL